MRVRILLVLFCLGLQPCRALQASAQPKDRTARVLEELSNAPGPSGFEGPVREILARELRAAGLEVSTDGLGSVIGVLHGSSDRPRIMLAAHMDEVGALV